MEKPIRISLPWNGPGKYAGYTVEISLYDDDIDFSIDMDDGEFQCLFSLPKDKVITLAEALKDLAEKK